MSFPVSIRNRQKRLDTFHDIYTLLLTQPPSLFDGLRYEMRVAAIYPQQAQQKVHEQRPYDLHSLFGILVRFYFVVAVPTFLT